MYDLSIKNLKYSKTPDNELHLTIAYVQDFESMEIRIISDVADDVDLDELKLNAYVFDVNLSSKVIRIYDVHKHELLVLKMLIHTIINKTSRFEDDPAIEITDEFNFKFWQMEHVVIGNDVVFKLPTIHNANVELSNHLRKIGDDGCFLIPVIPRKTLKAKCRHWGISDNIYTFELDYLYNKITISIKCIGIEEPCTFTVPLVIASHSHINLLNGVSYEELPIITDVSDVVEDDVRVVKLILDTDTIDVTGVIVDEQLTYIKDNCKKSIIKLYKLKDQKGLGVLLELPTIRSRY